MPRSNLALIEECTGRAYVNALATTRAGGLTPGLHQIGDDHGIDSAAHYVPHVGAFNLVADPHAPRAQNASVVIGDKALVRCIDCKLRIAIRKPNVGQPLRLSHRLEFAVVVGYAH